MGATLQLQYSLIELGILLDKDPRTVTRWLAARQVPIAKLGRERVVWLADLASAIPEFERSLLIKREFDRAS